MKTVIYHSADYDGIFCREIAKRFLGTEGVNYIGWNFGDPKVIMPDQREVYILDLSPDCLEVPFTVPNPIRGRIVWIDHHKSSIEKWPNFIPGYRIDGVAACRLAWQWFAKTSETTEIPCPGCGAMAHPVKVTCEQGKECPHCGGIHWGSAFCPFTVDDQRTNALPSLEEFIDRKVKEPLAVRLAGEYDVWDKRDPDAATFQYGLIFVERGSDFWEALLRCDDVGKKAARDILGHGEIAQKYQQKIDAALVTHRSYRLNWEGINWMVLNTGRFNSLTFEALDKPETGHDALMGYMFNGKVWTVSLYHAKHRTDLDLSQIAVKYGGGGHRGACGFTCNTFPFLTQT